MIRNLSLVSYYKAKVQALFLISRLLSRKEKKKRKEPDYQLNYVSRV